MARYDDKLTALPIHSLQLMMASNHAWINHLNVEYHHSRREFLGDLSKHHRSPTVRTLLEIESIDYLDPSGTSPEQFLWYAIAYFLANKIPGAGMLLLQRTDMAERMMLYFAQIADGKEPTI